MYTKGFWIIFPSYGQIGSKVVWGKCVLVVSVVVAVTVLVEVLVSVIEVVKDKNLDSSFDISDKLILIN